jgi:valyl-tRNA synthetase
VSASATLSGQSGPLEVHVDVSRFIDVDAERKRLFKERDDLIRRLSSIENKLANLDFVKKAPEDVVKQQRVIEIEVRQQIGFVDSAIAKLPPGD